MEFTVYPDDCDAYGHLNQASFLVLFERARWDALAGGPGMDAFTRHHTWPAVRQTTIEYLAQVLPGDRLSFAIDMTFHGRTSFHLRQVARRVEGGAVVAEAEFKFVCIGKDGRPSPVPPEVSLYFGARPSRRTGAVQHLSVRGIATAVELHGDGAALLFVHGFPLDRTMWRQVASMNTRWRRIVPDLRGMGLTDAGEGTHGIPRYADDVIGLLDTLHIEQAVVCGMSMGGYVALDLLSRHPDRVRALILVNTRAAADDDKGKAGRNAMIARVRREGPGFLAHEMIPKLFAPASLKIMPEVVAQARGMVAHSTPEGVIGALEAMRDRQDSTALLGEIRVPTLVLVGSEDQLIPATVGRAMSDAIPGAQFASIPNAGHLAPMEQPVNTSRVIGEFLDALP